MQSARVQTGSDADASKFRGGNLHVLITVAGGSIMAAVHTTREGAMAAVDWVESEAETRLTGSLCEQYVKAQHVEGQRGRMDVIRSPILSGTK